MDYAAMRLRANGDKTLLDNILQQECREKCQRKLAVLLEQFPDFRFPSAALAEMSSSWAAAKFHASLVENDAKVLDMTAGLGIDAMAIAQTGAQVTAIELDNEAARCLNHNVNFLELENIQVINADSIEYLKSCPESYDVIFIDPARRDASGRHFSLGQSQPNVIENLELILSHCQKLIIKASPMLDLTAVRRELCQDCDITILGTQKECKELIIYLPGTGKTDNVTLDWMPESKKVPGDFLFIPFPALMKATSFDKIPFERLHKLTHVFRTHEADFALPGTYYTIIEEQEFNKKTIKNFAVSYPVINVLTRNFPISAPELEKRLKIIPGGDFQLIAVTTDEGKKLFITRKFTIS